MNISNNFDESKKNLLILNEKFDDMDSKKNMLLESRFSRKSKNASNISHLEEDKEDVNATPVYHKNPNKLVLNLPIEKKDKPNIKSEKIRNVSLEPTETNEAVKKDSNPQIKNLTNTNNIKQEVKSDKEDQITKPIKLTSFESFSRKEEEKVINNFNHKRYSI